MFNSACPVTWERLGLEFQSHGAPFTCIGYAPSQGGRCHNPIARENGQIAAAEYRHLRATPRLRDIAELCLCKRYHRNQANTVAAHWSTDVSQSASPGSATSTPSSSVTSTPTHSSVSTPATTPSSSPASSSTASADATRPEIANAGLEARTATLGAELRIAQINIANLTQQTTGLTQDRNNFQSRLTQSRRIHEEEQRALLEELAELGGSNTDLRAQQVDLYQSLKIAQAKVTELDSTKAALANSLDSETRRCTVAQATITALESANRTLNEEIDNLKDQNTILSNHLTSLRLAAAKLQRAREYTRLKQAMKEEIAMLELANDLQAQDLRDTERRHAEELRRQQLQEEAEQQRTRRAEMQHRVLQRRELRSQLRAKQEQWDSYSAAWQDFENLLATSPRRTNIAFVREPLLECFQGFPDPSEPEVDVALCVPWPTHSGLLHDVNTANVQAFYLNSVPGLTGLSDPERLREGIAALEKELSRWRGKVLLRALTGSGMLGAVDVVSSVVSGLLGDSRGELGRVEGGL